MRRLPSLMPELSDAPFLNFLALQGHHNARRVAHTRCVKSWELGQAIRRWRDRAAPETMGVPPAAVGALPGCVARSSPG